MKPILLPLLLVESDESTIQAISDALDSRRDRYELHIARTPRDARHLLSSISDLALVISSSDSFGKDFIKNPIESIPFLLLVPPEVPSQPSSFFQSPFYAPFILEKTPRILQNLPSHIEQIRCDWKVGVFQKALRHSELTLRAVVESATDAIVCVDESTRIFLLNPAAERLFGFPQSELLTTRLDRFFPPDLQPQSRFRLARLLTLTREPSSSPSLPLLRFRRNDHSILTLEASISSFQTQDHSFFSLIFRDISERLRLEEQALTVQKMESLGRLAGSIAHDFNNLLSVIVASAEPDLFASLPPDAAQAFHLIQETAERGAKLTKQLLSLARGASTPALKEIHIHEILRRVESFLQALLGKTILLSFDLSPHLPLLFLDPDQIEQILLNLAANARDAMPSGGNVLIQTRLLPLPPSSFPELPPRPHVLLSFQDNGCGIPPDILPRIFEPFFTTKSSKGTGLGLSSSYRIARQHHGHLYAESSPEGSSFYLLLPTPAPPSDP